MQFDEVDLLQSTANAQEPEEQVLKIRIPLRKIEPIRARKNRQSRSLIRLDRQSSDLTQQNDRLPSFGEP